MGILLLCGCGSTKALVTESKIAFNPATGQTMWALPKDFSGSWLEVKQSLVLTNGLTNNFSMTISNFVFRNNPMVLDSQGARDVNMINAFGAAFNNGLQTGMSTAGKAVVPVP